MRAVRALSLVLFGAFFGAACSSNAKVSVTLTTSMSPIFDPFQGTSALRKIRISVDGQDQYDDVATDLSGDMLSVKSASFEDFPKGRVVTVRAEGFDEVGNLVAYGAVEDVSVDGDVSVSVPFHRNLAFITHRDNGHQKKPGSALYVLDVASRTYSTTLRLPGNNPIGFGVSARGGDGVLVTYSDGPDGFVGYLSADTGQWTSIPLMHIQDLAVAAPGQKLGVAAGGTSISIFDLEAKTVLADFSIGGTVSDGAISSDGKHAIFALDDVSPGIITVELGDACTAKFEQARCIKALDVVESAAGIALAPDGHTVFITSSAQRSVSAFDLDRGRQIPLENGFAAPVHAAAFAGDIQAVVAFRIDSAGAGSVLTFVVPGRQGLSLDDAIQTLNQPSDIAADPSGHRLLVVAAGSSTATAGLTVIDTSVDVGGHVSLTGSSGLYPTDPEDTYMDRGGFVGRQRYQPAHLAILHGR